MHYTNSFLRRLLTLEKHSKTIDAKCDENGRNVVIKQIYTDNEELAIACYFSSHDIRSDPRNHCVPVIDAFVDSMDPRIAFIVMPLLRGLDDPPFELVDDVLEFADQVMEVRTIT